MTVRDDISTMAQVITLYYVENLSQQEIADRLFFSRSKVSRLLQRSKEMKIVEININYPVEREGALEERLAQRYGLQEAVVIKRYSEDYHLMLQRLCAFAGGYVDKRLTDGMTLGLSWGTTVYNFVHRAAPTRAKDVAVVQLVGALGDGVGRDYDPIELIRNMSVKYGGSFFPLYAPLYVENGAVADSLRRETLISRTLERGKKADILLTGVSCFDETSNVSWECFLTRAEKRRLLDKGAVGVYFAHFIDKDGQVVCHEIDARAVGIGLADVQKNPQVITVAAGVKKQAATRAVLQGGYANVLVVDDGLAEAILSAE